jgi:hypothetical protein
MPQTFWLFSFRHTTIILVDSNLNMIEGDLRQMDQSTTITNRDAFNIESNTVTEQQLPLTTSLVVGNDGKVFLGLEASRALIYNGCYSVTSSFLSQDPSAVRHEQDRDQTSGKRRTSMRL